MSNETNNRENRYLDEDTSPIPTARSRTSVVVTPLPKLQIFFTLLIQGVEPITAGVIYPFIPEFIATTGITRGDESKIGYYAGIVESLFFLSESLTVTLWGRASDLYGRRPILLFGPLGLIFAMLGFGLSKTFWPLVVFRCAQGMFNGNIGVTKTVLAELSDDTNRPDAFALISVAWTSGATLGPAIGGFFANPATRWPNTFGEIVFFQNYPYFLPCVVAGLFALLAFIFALLGLKETHPLYKVKPSRGPDSGENRGLLSEGGNTRDGYGTISTESVPEENHNAARDRSRESSYRSLMTPGLKTTLISQGFLALTDMSYVVLIPLIYSASTHLGGLGFAPFQIGTILGIVMFVNALNQATFSKWLVKKFGARTLFIVSYGCFLANFVGLMVMRMLVKRAGEVTTTVWVVLVVQQIFSLAISTAYTSMHILIVDNAPKGSLGTVNGLAQMISSGTRAFGPAFASSLFALSLQSGLLGGYFVDAVLIGITVTGVWFAVQLPLA
ncbi:MFS general substrate transporter [Marasmius fiardii PR-910]|nr:MFS general substrate transporter [Marasmius fiardii PR-910]